MKVVLNCDNFSFCTYELCIGEKELAFCGEKDPFSIPYSKVKDFIVTQNAGGKSYFTVFCKDQIFEGRIAEPEKTEPFVTALSSKLNGTVNIEIHNK